MSTSLNLTDYTRRVNGVELDPEQRLVKARQVTRLGTVALVLLVTGIIPILGFFGLIASLVLSRYALRVARENFVPEEYERRAYWASLISSIILILAAVGLILAVLR